MWGNSVAFFLDTYDQVMPEGNRYYGQPPVYVPRDTGLEKLLEHYGLTVKQSYVLDENCFIQRRQTRDGGIFVWLGRIARKKRIGLLFQKREEL